ncbi:hypothetical protein J4209_05740 [Candidatus Woesearchaeota archaeon]|nr:hypothetical protein [Candidatus Woesearchaeota archaeon]
MDLKKGSKKGSVNHIFTGHFLPKGKKGFIEIQFNWIFILVVGTIILIFFIMLIAKQKDVSEERVNKKILTYIDGILTGTEVRKKVTNTVDIPNIELEFGCDSYTIAKSGAPKSFRARHIFAPNSVKGRKLIGWSYDWSIPYRVTNFLYLTTPQIRYMLIGSTDLAKEINSSIPEDINNEFYPSLPALIDKNNNKVKFVFFNQNPSGDLSVFSGMDDKDVTAIKITESSNKLDFYEKEGNSWSSSLGISYYFGEASLMGAIFSDYKDNNGEAIYDCVMRKAFKKLNLITDIYKSRSESLYEYYNSMGDNCKTYHSSAKTKLGEIKSFSNILSQGFPQDISSIKTKSEELFSLNDYAQLDSCTLIY